MSEPLKTGGTWVVKDPRMCRLLPLWQPLFSHADNDIRPLFVLRSPLSVAASLAKRDSFSKGKSLLLWLRHYLEAEAATREWPREWVTFDKLTTGKIQQISEPIKNVLGRASLAATVVEEAAQTFDISLVHHQWEHQKTIDELEAYPWVARAWQALNLLGTTSEVEAQADLDNLLSEIRGADLLTYDEVGASDTIDHGERYFWLRQEIELYQRSVNTQREEISTQRAELNTLRDASTLMRSQLDGLHELVATQHHSALAINQERFDNLSAAIRSDLSAAADALQNASAAVDGKLEVLHQSVARQHQSGLAIHQERLNSLVAAVPSDQRAELDALRSAAVAVDRRLKRLHEFVTKQHESTLDVQQERLESLSSVLRSDQRKALDAAQDASASVNTQMDQMRELVLDRHNSALATQQERLEVLQRGVRDSYMADTRQIHERLSALENVLTGRFEKRHLALLDKSLDLSARIETKWASTRDELDALLGAINETGPRSMLGGDTVTQFRAANADFDNIIVELDDARSAKDEILRSKTWRYTAAVRKLFAVLGNLFSH